MQDVEMPNFAFYGGLVWEGMKSVCFGGGGNGGDDEVNSQ